MVLADFPKRFASPIFRGQVKSGLWLTERKEESIFVDLSRHDKRTFAAVVSESIGENFGKCFLQKLSIDIQHRVTGLSLPADLRALLGEIVADLAAQVFHKIDDPIRNGVGLHITDCSGEPL